MNHRMSRLFFTRRIAIFVLVAASVATSLFYYEESGGTPATESPRQVVAQFSGTMAGAGYHAILEDRIEGTSDSFLLYPVWTSVATTSILRLVDADDTAQALAEIPASHGLVCAGPKGAYYRPMSDDQGTASLRISADGRNVEYLSVRGDIGLNCSQATIISRNVCGDADILFDRYVSPEIGRLSVCRNSDGVGGIKVLSYTNDPRKDKFWELNNIGAALIVRAHWLPWEQSALIQVVLPHVDYVGTLSDSGWTRPIKPLQDGPWSKKADPWGAPRPLVEVLRPDSPIVTTISSGSAYIGYQGSFIDYSVSALSASIDRSGKNLLMVDTEAGDLDSSTVTLSIVPLINNGELDH